MTLKIRESQVEDVLATYPEITQKILNSDKELSLLARQKILNSGRLDLLFISADKLLLLELKVEKFKDDFVDQVIAYRSDLFSIQGSGLLPRGPIKTYLLCPEFTSDAYKLCGNHDIVGVKYSPERVLQDYFGKIKTSIPFVELRPMDSGLWNIHLINRVLYALNDTNDLGEIAKKTELSIKTIKNHIRFAEQLCLVDRDLSNVSLTTLGKQYVFNRDQSAPIDIVSDEQADLIQGYILENPFATPTIFGIYQIVETTFNLAKNTYPVPMDMIKPQFRDASGKRFEWQTAKSVYHGARMYSNYAIELGLLASVGNKLLITPRGIGFILLLQLYKGIKMVKAGVN